MVLDDAFPDAIHILALERLVALSRTFSEIRPLWQYPLWGDMQGVVWVSVSWQNTSDELWPSLVTFSSSRSRAPAISLGAGLSHMNVTREHLGVTEGKCRACFILSGNGLRHGCFSLPAVSLTGTKWFIARRGAASEWLMLGGGRVSSHSSAACSSGGGLELSM